MKRVCLVIISILILCYSLASSALGTISTKETKKRAYSLYDGEEILYIPVSNSKTVSVGYLEDELFNIGPESFVIEDNVIYILDTVNSRIIIKTNDGYSTIDLPCVSYPRHMCVAYGNIYLTDNDSGYLFEVSIENCAINKYELPVGIESDYVYKIQSNEDGYICLIDQDLQTYTFDSELHRWSKSVKIICKATGEDLFSVSADGRNTITIRTGKNTVAQFINHSNGRFALGVYELVPDVPVIMFERTIRFYNIEGELVGCTLIEENDAFAYPADDVYESSDGSIYVMHCLKDGVYITKPILRTEYDSEMEQKYREAYEIYMQYGAKTKTQGPAITSYTRDTVRTRAMSCANYLWTFKPSKNATIRTYNDTTIVLPKEEAGVTRNTSLKGIPYCRGMHDGPSSFASKLNTIYQNDGLNKYYTAGNVAAHHVYGSTGLDCSGLVCYAYNAPSNYYWTTSDFADPNNGYYISTVSTTGTETESHIELMKKMDYMVKAGNHIVLYDKWLNANYVKVIHASRTIDGKVVYKSYKFDNLKGFLMKSPYSCTVSGCQYDYTNNGTKHICTCSVCGYSFEENHSYRSAYSYSEVYHFHECIKCHAQKDVAYHTFVWNGIIYKCSVCGYETNDPITPYFLVLKPRSLNKGFDPVILQP